MSVSLVITLFITRYQLTRLT